MRTQNANLYSLGGDYLGVWVLLVKVDVWLIRPIATCVLRGTWHYAHDFKNLGEKRDQKLTKESKNFKLRDKC